jgi:23S rRNA (uracil1939-C5)-methyltransferase
MPIDIPSQERAKPACPHFGLCGGCQLQHLAYSDQLATKSTRLSQMLAATGLALPPLQIHASPPLAYRNRIRLTLTEVEGQLRAGYLCSEAGCPTSGFSDASLDDNLDLDDGEASPRGITFLPIDSCPIAAPILWRATVALLAQLNQSPSLWLRDPRCTPDQLELFASADESLLQFTLTLRTAARSVPAKLSADFSALCDALRTRLPELTGTAIAILPLRSPQRSRRNEQPRPGPIWGKPGLSYRVAETAYWVPRAAFFQVNRFLIPNLLSLVTANRRGQLAFDLYAGVGLFSRVLAANFAHVTAVEIAEPAASALAATKLGNLHAIKATTLDFLRNAVVSRDHPDLIVLDPPRSGAGSQVCALLARINAPTLVYVSCSPQTLAADLTTLASSGYRLRELHLFDLFPQTTHIETVALLTC